jgi:IMP dehydrogenase/GMP reductase
MPNNVFYEYDQVFIHPNYSEIMSRTEVDTSVVLKSSDSTHSMKLRVPVIAANMDTVTEGEMAKTLAEAGACGAIHRFLPIADNVLSYIQVSSNPELECFVSIGTSRDWQERATALHSAGARYFIVDIAHGHSKMMKDTIKWLRHQFGRNIFIMAGNVGTPEATRDLDIWGADAIKIGIGGGCFTPGQKVITDSGLKPIEKIVVGDNVLTHTGVYKPVTNTFTFYDKKEIVRVNSIEATPNHEFYVVHKQYQDLLSEDNIHEYAEWISAENLTIDYLLIQHV